MFTKVGLLQSTRWNWFRTYLKEKCPEIKTTKEEHQRVYSLIGAGFVWKSAEVLMSQTFGLVKKKKKNVRIWCRKYRKGSIISSYKWMALGQSSLESAFYMFDFHKKKGICKQVWDSTVHWFRFREKKIPFTIDETLSTEVWKKKN